MAQVCNSFISHQKLQVNDIGPYNTQMHTKTLLSSVPCP